MPKYPLANVIYAERIANAAAPVQSAEIDTSNAGKMLIKAEFSTNTDTAVLSFLFKDINGVTLYTIDKSIANSGKQLGLTNAGWYQGRGFAVDVKEAHTVVIYLVSITGGNIYVYAGERYDKP